VLDRLRGKHSSLLRIWALSLSSEARHIQDFLLAEGRIKCEEIPARLQRQGFDRYRGDRTIEELMFSGIARRDVEYIVLTNEIYAAFARAHAANQPGTEDERSAWATIEQLELVLRRLVRTRYGERWSAEADSRIAKVIGAKSWATILDNKAKAARSYRFSSHTPDSDSLHYAYLGQLSQLVAANQAWDMFAHMFRDKRELDDMIADIMPVRNDSAHFRSVPERELVRCKLRCQDLLYILKTNGFHSD